MSVLFICTGNICRSPSADAILKQKLQAQNILHIHVDSAGLGGWHEGDAPDQRAIKTAKKYGFDISHIRARQITPDDYFTFDDIIAMDDGHYRYLLQNKPPQSGARIRYFCDYFMEQPHCSVADPYYGSIEDFDMMMQQIITGCDAIVKDLTQK